MGAPVSRIGAVFWLDLTLLISICALESENFTGLSVHEWLALASVGLILIHLLFAWTWIAAGPRGLVGRNSRRTRVNYLLNFCLFVSMTTVLYSGWMISEVALPALGIKMAPGNLRWIELHGRASTFVVILAGLHLAINWDWSLAAARRCLTIGPE